MSQQLAYKIDLTKIDGEGDFPCPRCRINISPEDETTNTYNILRTRSENKTLKEVIIMCNMCRSTIHLVGFQLLKELDN